jgi:disulfide bond formation protein DsbB
LGGQLLFGLGIGGAIAALMNANQLFLLLMLGGTISITVFLLTYSYWVWKNDPERQSIER